MHSHPAKHHSTVAINALWCLLIALTLLAFPIIARQVRIQSGTNSRPVPTAPATNEAPKSGNDAVLVTQTETPAAAPR